MFNRTFRDDSERSNLFGSPPVTGRETPRFGSSPPSHGSTPCETFGEMFGPTAWHDLPGAISRWQVKSQCLTGFSGDFQNLD
jgi:hypothetical protein